MSTDFEGPERFETLKQAAQIQLGKLNEERVELMVVAILDKLSGLEKGQARKLANKRWGIEMAQKENVENAVNQYITGASQGFDDFLGTLDRQSDIDRYVKEIVRELVSLVIKDDDLKPKENDPQFHGRLHGIVDSENLRDSLTREHPHRELDGLEARTNLFQRDAVSRLRTLAVSLQENLGDVSPAQTIRERFPLAMARLFIRYGKDYFNTEKDGAMTRLDHAITNKDRSNLNRLSKEDFEVSIKEKENGLFLDYLSVGVEVAISDSGKFDPKALERLLNGSPQIKEAVKKYQAVARQDVQADSEAIAGAWYKLLKHFQGDIGALSDLILDAREDGAIAYSREDM